MFQTPDASSSVLAGVPEVPICTACVAVRAPISTVPEVPAETLPPARSRSLTRRETVRPAVTLIDPGESVALQTRRLLEKTRLNTPDPEVGTPRQLSWLCTAAPERLALAADKWLGIHAAQVEQVQI